MDRFQLPDVLTVLTIEAGTTLEAFRIVKAGTLDDPALPESFRSNHARGKAPRRVEITHPELHKAISCWRTLESARAMARVFPALGGHVARLVLPADEGITYMDPSTDKDPEHLRIWGEPAQFVASATDLFKVNE